MSVPVTTATADAHAKRWREWQLKNEHHQRRAASRARVVFTLIFLAVALWLAVQLVSSQVR